MFRNAQVGDRVWDFISGWGTIDSVSDENIGVIFDNNKNHRRIFRIYGYRYDLNVKSLFWNVIQFGIPEKTFNLENELKRLEIKEFDAYENNYTLGWDNSSNKIFKNFYNITETPIMKYFTEESIDKFINDIKNKKISKEEFFSAYKKVFG